MRSICHLPFNRERGIKSQAVVFQITRTRRSRSALWSENAFVGQAIPLHDLTMRGSRLLLPFS